MHLSILAIAPGITGLIIAYFWHKWPLGELQGYPDCIFENRKSSLSNCEATAGSKDARRKNTNLEKSHLLE